MERQENFTQMDQRLTGSRVSHIFMVASAIFIPAACFCIGCCICYKKWTYAQENRIQRTESMKDYFDGQDVPNFDHVREQVDLEKNQEIKEIEEEQKVKFTAKKLKTLSEKSGKKKEGHQRVQTASTKKTIQNSISSAEWDPSDESSDPEGYVRKIDILENENKVLATDYFKKDIVKINAQAQKDIKGFEPKFTIKDKLKKLEEENDAMNSEIESQLFSVSASHRRMSVVVENMDKQPKLFSPLGMDLGIQKRKSVFVQNYSLKAQSPNPIGTASPQMLQVPGFNKPKTLSNVSSNISVTHVVEKAGSNIHDPFKTSSDGNISVAKSTVSKMSKCSKCSKATSGKSKKKKKRVKNSEEPEVAVVEVLNKYDFQDIEYAVRKELHMQWQWDQRRRHSAVCSQISNPSLQMVKSQSESPKPVDS